MLVVVGEALRENDEQEMMIYLAWIVLESTLTEHACRTSSNVIYIPLYEGLAPIPAHQHETPINVRLSGRAKSDVMYSTPRSIKISWISFSL